VKLVADRLPIELIPTGAGPRVRRRKARIVAGNVWPGLLELALMAGAALAFVAGFVILGTLLAWVLAGGPAAEPIAPGALWLRGAGIGLAMMALVGIGLAIGARRR